MNLGVGTNIQATALYLTPKDHAILELLVFTQVEPLS